MLFPDILQSSLQFTAVPLPIDESSSSESPLQNERNCQCCAYARKDIKDVRILLLHLRRNADCLLNDRRRFLDGNGDRQREGCCIAPRIFAGNRHFARDVAQYVLARREADFGLLGSPAQTAAVTSYPSHSNSSLRPPRGARQTAPQTTRPYRTIIFFGKRKY